VSLQVKEEAVTSRSLICYSVGAATDCAQQVLASALRAQGHTNPSRVTRGVGNVHLCAFLCPSLLPLKTD